MPSLTENFPSRQYTATLTVIDLKSQSTITFSVETYIDSIGVTLINDDDLQNLQPGKLAPNITRQLNRTYQGNTPFEIYWAVLKCLFFQPFILTVKSETGEETVF